MSIDVGILHLGISISELEEDYSFRNITWIDLIDITKYTHKHCSIDDCKLHHTKTISDWMSHVIQENKDLFDNVDVILIERQPPGTFVAIEQFIFSSFREKTILISPRVVHTHFKISSLDYDSRKAYSLSVAIPYLSEPLKNQLMRYERSHDIADSICIMLYWQTKKYNEYKKNERKKEWETRLTTDGVNIFQHLDSYRFVPQKSKIYVK